MFIEAIDWNVSFFKRTAMKDNELSCWPRGLKAS